MKRKTSCCFSGAVKKVKTKVLSSEGELKSRIKVIDQLGRTGKVRLENVGFQMVNGYCYSTFINCTNSDSLVGLFVPRDTGL